MNKRNQPQGTQVTTKPKKWINHILRSHNTENNLFKHTNLQTAFRPTNTTNQQLSQRRTNSNKPSGIHQLKCNTCKNSYVGQSGRPITTRYKEHIRYDRTTPCLHTQCTYSTIDTNLAQKKH